MGRRERAKKDNAGPVRRAVSVSVAKARKDFAQVLTLARRNDVALTRGRRIVAYVVSAARYRELVSSTKERAKRNQSDVFALVRKLLSLPAAGAKQAQCAANDRLVRLTAVFVCAARTLEDVDYVASWLREPNERLGNRTPRELAETEHGTQMVLDALMAIEYGLPT